MRRRRVENLAVVLVAVAWGVLAAVGSPLVSWPAALTMGVLALEVVCLKGW